MDEEIKIQPVKTETGGRRSAYDDAMEALRQAENRAPEYAGSYDAEISELFGKITNRKQFSYDPESDPVYGAYRDRYVREGKLAMRDSMGKAAALTGGYASSYGQSVGQQSYETYLQKLSDVIPELYEKAYDRYRDEGESLMNRYKLAADRAESEYERHRDLVEDAKYGFEAQQKQEEQQYSREQDAYNRLYTLISKTGYEASDEELQNAGMSREQAEAVKHEYMRINKLLPAGSSGGASAVNYYNYFSNQPSATAEDVRLAKETKKLTPKFTPGGDEPKWRRK